MLANVFPTRFTNTAEARLRFGDRVDRLGPFLTKVDPLADAVVLAIEALPPGVGWRMFEEGLHRRRAPDMPAAMSAFLDDVTDVPAWVDWKVCDAGGNMFVRTGALGGAVLGARSLILGYASPGGNKPLVFSGRLKEQANRRINETAKFVQAVSRPGGMRPFAEGWQITVKVRLIHAQVRRMILKTDRWDAGAWGAPINQHDMAGTTLLFSVSMLDGLRKLGLRITAEESDSYMHLWRWAGRVIGVDQAILPASERDAARIADVIEATTGEPDRDSRDLTKALFDGSYDQVKTMKQRRDADRQLAWGHTICRELIGNELADKLGVGESKLRFAMPMVRRIVGGLERARALPFAKRRATEMGTRYWDRVVTLGLAGANAEFNLPDRLFAA